MSQRVTFTFAEASVRSALPIFVCALIQAICWGSSAWGQEQEVDIAVAPATIATSASEVFRRATDQVVQVRIIERTSGTKASLGSGFFVDTDAHLITNYHVAAKLVFEPERYRAEVMRQGGTPEPAELVTFDIIRDLAVLKVASGSTSHIELKPADLQKGDRLFSLGNPHDLGFTIVEGTFNGFAENSMYEKIHLTGSLNPGMSGGPSITADGKLAGVNVSSRGNQISFLVPAKYAFSLLARLPKDSVTPGPALLTLARDQLMENQNAMVSQLLAVPFPTIALGPYHVPAALLPVFKCWSNASAEKNKEYSYVVQQCSTEDVLFVNTSMVTGEVYLYHSLMSSETLNRFQFYDLYETTLNEYDDAQQLSEEDATNFRCKTDFVVTNGVRLKTVLCARAYKQLPGLYDFMIVAGSLNENLRGLLSYMRVSGVSFENMQKLNRAFLQSLSWNKP